MTTKYLKAFKTKGRRYWWLVEAHREGGKVLQKKIKYWGVNRPGEKYRLILMPLDDGQPLDDLWLIWQTDIKVWHWQKRGDFSFWYGRGQEEWFWKSFLVYVLSLYDADVEDVWITRASNRSNAIQNVKEKRATELSEVLVLLRLKGLLPLYQ